MPSPFPGMDPYLEGELWPGIHHELAVETKQHLAPLLRPNYYPFTERYYLTEADESAIDEEKINPDVSIVEENPGRIRGAPTMKESRAPVVLELPENLRISHYRIAIRDLATRRLVTVIEFLSPTNKRGDGREEYLRKRARIIRSSVHLVEIDLLRRGLRVPIKGKLPPGNYYAYVSRAQQRPKIRVWPISLEDPLPHLPIPLRKKNEQVSLDLAKVMTAVYDLGEYAGLLNYRRPPDVPLSEHDAAWTDELLRAKGLRKATSR